jgi:hypothetical protein
VQLRTTIARATESTCLDKAAEEILPTIVLTRDDLKTISLTNPRTSRARSAGGGTKTTKAAGVQTKKIATPPTGSVASKAQRKMGRTNRNLTLIMREGVESNANLSSSIRNSLRLDSAR